MKIPLFDIDWTLLDKGDESGRNIHHESFLEAYKVIYGLPDPRELNVEGKIDNQIILETVAANGVDEGEALEKLPSAIEVMRRYFSEHMKSGKLNPLPGVKELLEALRARDAVSGLLTGNVGEIAWGKLDNAGIKDFFGFGAFGDEAYRRVDLIEIARGHAEEAAGRDVTKDELIIIGDTPLDVACAKAGGIRCIGVATGMYREHELSESGADLVVPNLSDKNKVLDFLELD